MNIFVTVIETLGLIAAYIAIFCFLYGLCSDLYWYIRDYFKKP
jgi:hypothetical protein